MVVSVTGSPCKDSKDLEFPREFLLRFLPSVRLVTKSLLSLELKIYLQSSSGENASQCVSFPIVTFLSHLCFTHCLNGLWNHESRWASGILLSQ